MHPVITITLTLPQILAMPGEAVLSIIRLAGDQIDPCEAYDLEAKGRGRWIVLNELRSRFKNFPKKQ